MVSYFSAACWPFPPAYTVSAFSTRRSRISPWPRERFLGCAHLVAAAAFALRYPAHRLPDLRGFRPLHRRGPHRTRLRVFSRRLCRAEAARRRARGHTGQRRLLDRRRAALGGTHGTCTYLLRRRQGQDHSGAGAGAAALGDGFRVCVCQFLKGAKSGETEALERFEDAVLLRAEDRSGKFLWQMNEKERAECLARQRELLERAAAANADLYVFATKRSTPCRSGRFPLDALLERTEGPCASARKSSLRAMTPRRRCF